MTVYGTPSRFAGSNLIALAAAMARSVKPYGKPLTGTTLPTCPEASSVTLTVTIPPVKLFFLASSVKSARGFEMIRTFSVTAGFLGVAAGGGGGGGSTLL